MPDGSHSAPTEMSIAERLKSAAYALDQADALVCVAWTSLEAGEIHPECVRTVLAEHAWCQIDQARTAVKEALEALAIANEAHPTLAAA